MRGDYDILNIKKYRTMDSYPQRVFVRGVVICWAKCGYCGEFVYVRGQKLEPHKDIYPTRWCEGGNRYYWNMFGTRLEEER